MSYDGSNIQQLQSTNINVTSASDQLSLSSSNNSVCEPMFELEGAEFNEELLKEWLNDFSITEIVSACSVDDIQQTPSSTASAQHSGNSSSSSNLQSLQQSGDNKPVQGNRLSPANIQPLLQSNVTIPAKRNIKPRTQLSNQEITRLLLVYMSKALASQQSASTAVNDKSKQGVSSASCLQTGNQASSTTKNAVQPSNQNSAQSLNPESTNLLQLPRASNVARLRSTDSNQSAAECVTFKSKRKCRKSKSTGTSGTASGLERVDCSGSVSRTGGMSNSSQRMECGAFVSREVYRKSGHTKVRPYNSLDLPKVHDPLGLMDFSKDRTHSMQQPNVTGSSSGKVTSGSYSAAAMESSSCEMDLSPLVQILETVKTVPNFESTAKPNCNKKGAPTIKTLCNAKEKNKHRNVPGSSDQVTPISDIFNTVNNLPNLLDIQSVLKYVQKRKAMRKLYRRRSHSAGSIDDLKKESKSSASLKAYTELLKANSHRLQRQLVPDQSLISLQSCMTTQSTVNDNDFDFLRSIGIDPDRVTNDIKNDLGDKTQQDAKLQTEIPTDFDNRFHQKNSRLLKEVPTESTDSQPCNSVQYPNVSSNGLLPTNDQPPVLQYTDIPDFHDIQMPMDAMSTIASELNHTEDNTASHTMANVYFTPEWAHTQGLIKVLIHGPFVSSSTSYVCYFGDLPVEAKMEQWGILSCTCPPANAPGFVTVKITWEQKFYTCLQQFEYRLPSLLEPSDKFTSVSKENVCRSDLLYRIDLLTKSCNVSSEVENMDENNHINISHWQFEQVVLHLVEKLISVCNHTVLMDLKPSYRTTILHLAVLLNLENVITKIKELVLSNTFPCSWESEFSPWTQDEEMCSPLMLSCQQGNVAISKLLLEWDPETITLTNFEGVTPVQCALQRGHASMVAELEKWILTISENQTDEQVAKSTESDIQQCPYSSNVYPMSSELYATDLEDILQSSNNDLLESHNELNANKEIKEPAVLTKPSERFLSTQNKSNTLNVDECRTSVVTGIESVSVDNSKFSSSPMFVTTNPCTASNDTSVLTVNELASGSSVCNNRSDMPSLIQESLSYYNSSGGNATDFEHAFAVSNSDTTSMSYSEPCPDVPMQFGDFRATSSPMLSSPSEPSSVISASPSSLSVSSDSCSVAEICELLGESPSVCQQDFSFPGLSDSEQQEIYHAARTIQHAFRKHKIQAQRHRSKEKHAAVLIETYYKKYKEMKQMNQAAVLIQKYYRRYKNSLARSKELERAALFIQQMYRYQHRLRHH